MGHSHSLNGVTDETRFDMKNSKAEIARLEQLQLTSLRVFHLLFIFFLPSKLSPPVMGGEGEEFERLSVTWGSVHLITSALLSSWEPSRCVLFQLAGTTVLWRAAFKSC